MKALFCDPGGIRLIETEIPQPLKVLLQFA
jgi:hypothetical protein